MLETVIVVVHLLAAIGIVGFVLIQQGKGAEAGASFGSGASATVFGSQGSSSFFSRVTAVLVVIFFATSLGLAYYAKQKTRILDNVGLPAVVQQQSESAPAVGELQAPALEETSEDEIPQLD